LGKTGLVIPDITFGSAILGNLFQILPDTTKLEILKAIFEHIPKPVAIDTAGKYGAGLALEVLGKYLRELGVSDEDVVISNKLGWLRKPLITPEPTFEPSVWFGLEHDAEQVISYDGILRCWEQGLEMLGGNYSTQLVSVHDPDEYIAAADSAPNRRKRLDDILGAYKALGELKAKGYVRAIGIGAKNWKIIAEISDLVNLDWVMLANSYTLYSHPADLLKFMDILYQKQIAIINAAVFNSGFLVGGDFFNYRKLDTTIPQT
jgi:D-threo-aldose 1-dehydrogenase